MRHYTNLGTTLWNPLHTPLWNPTSGSALAGGGAAPAFDPATLYTGGKKGVWIKPRDWSTLRQLYTGTTAVTAATNPVGYAADQSGNGVHMINADALKRPVAITVGSVNAIDFDGTDDSLKGAVSAGVWTGMDFFMAVYINAASSVCFGYESGKFLGVAQNGSATSATTSAGTPRYKINGTAVPGGTASTRDQLYDATTFGSWIIFEANGLDLSAWTFLEICGLSTFQINGKVAELILCESVSDAVRAQVRTYLGAAVGLTI